MQTRRQTIYQRGIYEQLYNQVEQDHPRLWTDRGPATGFRPRTLVRRVQWRLLKSWFSPQQTIDRATHDWTAAEDAGFGYWAKLKRHLLLSWLGKIDEDPADIEAVQPLAPAMEPWSAAGEPATTCAAVIKLDELEAQEMIVDAESDFAVRRLDPFASRPGSRGRQRSSVSAVVHEERSSSRASDALMIERRDLSDFESDSEENAVLGARAQDEESFSGGTYRR